MEDVLEVYTRPYDPHYPQVCMDEVFKQLLRDAHRPLQMEPGQPARQDYEYERGGVVNVFLFSASRFRAGAGWMSPSGAPEQTGLIRSKSWWTNAIRRPSA